MQSIGERLEEARKRKGLSIREASEATKIRSDYLHKFESNQFDINLPEIYVKGFLRTYANFLKAPSEKIIADYIGLGLGDTRNTRQLSREVYGRMDLSVGSKMEKDSKEKPSTTASEAEPIATNEDATPRNPATFVPPRSDSGRRNPVNIDLIVKGGALVLGLIIVIMLGIWLFRGSSSKPTGTNTAATSNDNTWVRPQPGETILPLVANGPVTVTVITQKEGITLFQGTIPRGDRRDIPWRGPLKIVSDPFQNLMIELNGKQYGMSGRETPIRAP